MRPWRFARYPNASKKQPLTEKPMHVVLINPYELGRQPFSMATLTAVLQQAGHRVSCVDLSRESLQPETFEDAGFVAISLGMHTATRIALEALPSIKRFAPDAGLCVFGLYAPMNANLFESLGVRWVLGGEIESLMLESVEAASKLTSLRSKQSVKLTNVISLKKQNIPTPDRSKLPSLSGYAKLNMPDGSEKTVAFAEASRGCKHVCRHCPVVPVYNGKFRIVPVDVVIADIRQQLKEGANHVSFGDPDFLNGPTHALRVLETMHAEFPQLTFDATIKVEHILKHAALMPTLAEYGCLFLTSAVEAVDDDTLEKLNKNHTAEDFARALGVLRENNIAMAPTFVAFTPWTQINHYIDLLEHVYAQALINSVPSIQLVIKLLVPKGSHMFNIDGFEKLMQPFDDNTLGYPWNNPDTRLDELQKEVMSIVEKADVSEADRFDTFVCVWEAAHRVADRNAPALIKRADDVVIPHMSEPWYCCAEPTERQLAGF